MNAIKHTPGPWLTRTAPTSAGLCHIVSAADWKGSFIYGDGIRPGVDDSLPKAIELAANARLIAAAPELLEALSKPYRGRHIARGEGPEWWEAGCAAIDKAEGRS